MENQFSTPDEVTDVNTLDLSKDVEHLRGMREFRTKVRILFASIVATFVFSGGMLYLGGNELGARLIILFAFMFGMAWAIWEMRDASA